LNGQLALCQNCQQGRMARKDADLAVGRARLDHLRRAGPHVVVRRDDFNFQFGHGYLVDPVDAWMLAHWRSTSVMSPTLKNACSAMWSTSPSQIAVKPS